MDEDLRSTKKRKEHGLERFDANFNENLAEVLDLAKLAAHDNVDEWWADFPNNLLDSLARRS